MAQSPTPTQVQFSEKNLSNKCAKDIDLGSSDIAQLVADTCFEALLDSLELRPSKVKRKTKKHDYIRERTNSITEVYPKVTNSTPRAHFLGSLIDSLSEILPLDCSKSPRQKIQLRVAFDDINKAFKALIEANGTTCLDIERWLAEAWYKAVKETQDGT